MKIAVSISAQRRCARVYAFLFALVIGAALMGADSASAKEPFTAFTYAAAPVLSSPGQGSQACMDTGVPLCPVGHTCDYYGYIGNAVGKPGFGKTNIEVCIKEDDPSLGQQNATGGNCAPASGLAQITYQINRRSSKVIVLGLVGQTCEAEGASIPSLTQDLSLTQGPWAGKMSISSLVTDGSTAYLSIYGTVQAGL